MRKRTLRRSLTGNLVGPSASAATAATGATVEEPRQPFVARSDQRVVVLLVEETSGDCNCGSRAAHNNGGNYHERERIFSVQVDREEVVRIGVSGNSRELFPADSDFSRILQYQCGCVALEDVRDSQSTFWESNREIVLVVEGCQHETRNDENHPYGQDREDARIVAETWTGEVVRL